MVVTAAHNWESGDWNLQTVAATCVVYLRRSTALNRFVEGAGE
jgi:hypothetical protein